MYPNHARQDGEVVRVVNGRSGAVLGGRVTLATGVLSRLRGLLGRNELPSGEGIWLAPCSSIHMFFMRFAIDVVFVDRAGTVVKPCAHVRPWSIARGGMRARAALEVPAGTIERSGTRVGDRLEIGSA